MKDNNMMIVGDLNCDFTRSEGGVSHSRYEKKLQDILRQYDLKVLNSEPTRVTELTSTVIDLIISSRDIKVKETRRLELGISDHMLIQGTVQMRIKRPPPRIVRGRSFKYFNEKNFQQDLTTAPWSVCLIFDDPDDCYWAWSKIFEEICDDHVPYREIKIRRVSLPWISPQIRHKMNLRYKSYKKAKRSDDAVLWSEYRKIKNKITSEVRRAKANYYRGLFDEVKNTRSHWKLLKKATDVKKRGNISDIRKADGSLAMNNKEKADTLNEYFANVGENLASSLLQNGNYTNTVNKVTPTIMRIELTQDMVYKEILKLKPNKGALTTFLQSY